MAVLAAQSIPRGILTPFFEQRIIHEASGLSYGLSACGYDIRLKQGLRLLPGGFALGSTRERFEMPLDLVGIVHDKSTLARQGVALQNTVIEPGWSGWLTLEITNHGCAAVELIAGQPIAQVLFHRLDQPTDRPYSGKYSAQPDRPVAAILEGR